MIDTRLLPADRKLLLQLLEMPTAGPLEEPSAISRLWDAQHSYTEAAVALGLEPVHHAAPAPEVLNRPDVPTVVRQAAARFPGFLADQPSLVLRLGPQLPANSTVMFNVHLDTVAGWTPPSFDGSRFVGRGAIDAKGPAVALLVGIRAAMEAEPSLGDRIGVLVQAVAGEEGGAMGTFGTRPLVEQGFVGRLNVFCEPTGGRYLPRSTAAMTAAVQVSGRDAIDDHPDAGHNASVLLGFLAQHLARVLPQQSADGRVCVAGLQTGPLHNRVYGAGTLLLNLSYGSPGNGRRVEKALSAVLEEGLTEFEERFGGLPDYARTAAAARSITTLEWRKRGLPALSNRDPWAERLLEEHAGIGMWPADRPAFTCDAIWMQNVPGAFTVVYGPGDLEANKAHAAGEHAHSTELERFASGVARLLTSFARSRSGTP